MRKIVFVMNIPSPYRLHTFDVMWSVCKRRGLDLHVHFMAHGHAERPKSWLNPKITFPHTYWKDYGYKSHHLNPGLVIELLKNPPDWICLGSPFDTFTSILTAFLNRKSVLCAWCEGNTKTPGQMHGFKGWFKRLVFSKCQFVAVPGEDGRRYIELHKALTKRRMPTIMLLPNLVDETRFRPRAVWPKEDIALMRAKLGALPFEKLCLIPARLDSVKGLVPFLNLIDANMISGWKVIILGQGTLHDEIVGLIKSRNLEPHVRVLDYVPYAEMPLFYASADLLLLPSLYDPNPLSLIEAVHSALPVAASSECGNIEEAVSDGVNGWVLPVRNGNLYQDVLRKVFSSDSETLQKMGQNSHTNNAVFWRSDIAVDRYIEGAICAIEKMAYSAPRSQ